jgi:hypothetical protein
MLCCVALVRTDVSQERRASIIKVTSISELGTTLAVTSDVRRLLVTPNVVPSSPILVTLMMETLGSCETSVITRATRRINPEDAIFHSHRCENLKLHTTELILNRRHKCYQLPAPKYPSRHYSFQILKFSDMVHCCTSSYISALSGLILTRTHVELITPLLSGVRPHV